MRLDLIEMSKVIVHTLQVFDKIRGRRRISHRKWKLSVVPRKLRYPPEKLSFQFSPILAFGGGVIRGR